MRFGAVVPCSMLALLTLSGCGSSAQSGASTAPVKGRVTFKGKALTRGSITFEPDGAGKDARGAINPDGTFVLSTYEKDDGAVVGTHRVYLSTTDRSVPAKFASPNTSKIEVEVNREKSDYPIDLK